jgi:hypothetical protein
LIISGNFNEAYKEAETYKQNSNSSYAISSDSYELEYKNAMSTYLSDENAPANQTEKTIYLLHILLPSRFYEPINKFSEALGIQSENLSWNHGYISALLDVKRIKKYGDTGEYVVHTSQDQRVCEHCKNMSEKKMPVKKLIIGVNYPPLHKDCRCWAEALIKGFKYEFDAGTQTIRHKS